MNNLLVFRSILKRMKELELTLLKDTNTFFREILASRNSRKHTVQYQWNIRNCMIRYVSLLMWTFRFQWMRLLFGHHWMRLLPGRLVSILPFFSKLFRAFNNINIFFFEKFPRFGCMVMKWRLFKNEDWQNCQSRFHIFYSKNLKIHKVKFPI